METLWLIARAHCTLSALDDLASSGIFSTYKACGFQSVSTYFRKRRSARAERRFQRSQRWRAKAPCVIAFLLLLLPGVGWPSAAYDVVEIRLEGFKQRQFYRKLAFRNVGQTRARTWWPYPLFAAAIFPVHAGRCGDPVVTSSFDYKFESGRKIFVEELGRFLRKSECLGESPVIEGEAQESMYYLWLFENMDFDTDVIDLNLALFLKKITKRLLSYDEPLELEGIHERLEMCRTQCSPHPEYLIALLLATADAYAREDSLNEAHLWREFALNHALRMPFFYQHAADPLLRHTLRALKHSIKVQDFVSARQWLRSAEKLDASDDLSYAATARLAIEANETAGNYTEALTSEMILYSSQPYYQDGGANYSKYLPLGTYRFRVEEGRVEYGFLRCDDATYSIDFESHWRLPQDMAGGEDKCRLFALGAVGSRVRIESTLKTTDQDL